MLWTLVCAPKVINVLLITATLAMTMVLVHERRKKKLSEVDPLLCTDGYALQ